MSDVECLQPPAHLIVKFGHLIRYLERSLDNGLGRLEAEGAKDLLAQGEIQQWLLQMEQLNLLPRVR